MKPLKKDEGNWNNLQPLKEEEKWQKHHNLKKMADSCSPSEDKLHISRDDEGKGDDFPRPHSV